MSFFKPHILDSKRKRELDRYFSMIYSTLGVLIDEAPTKSLKHSYSVVQDAVYNRNWLFYPSKYLQANVQFKGGKAVGYSATMGANVKQTWVEFKGSERIPHELNLIKIPAEHFFSPSGRITLPGSFTGAHELTHSAPDPFLTMEIARVLAGGRR